jgi:hypothetical protein
MHNIQPSVPMVVCGYNETGVGAKPRPDPPQNNTTCNLKYSFPWLHYKDYPVVQRFIGDYEGVMVRGGPGFESPRLQKTFDIALIG